MFERILVAADSTPTAARAVRTAAELARALGADLHIATAVPAELGTFAAAGPWVPMPPEALLPNLPTELPDHLGSILTEVGCPAWFHAAQGDPSQSIVAIADEIGADLVVVGNRNMRGMRRILGSVPNTVAHSANCSVLIVDTVTEPGERDGE